MHAFEHLATLKYHRLSFSVTIIRLVHFNFFKISSNFSRHINLHLIGLMYLTQLFNVTITSLIQADLIINAKALISL